MVKVNRKDLLNKLLMVEVGLSKGKSITQSSCVVIRKGRFYTLCQEIACAVASGLPSSMECAIQPDKLMALLKQVDHEELDVELVPSKSLNFQANGSKLKIPLEGEILLPVGEVELPKKWEVLDAAFEEAVDLAHRCTSKGDDSFTKQCVHIHPEWVEASDNLRFLRYPITNFVQKPTLVRGTSIKAIVGLGMTKCAETDGWLHFGNPVGLRVSVRKLVLEYYPNLTPCLSIKGRKAVFPKSLKDTAKRAGIFAEECVRVTVSSKKGVTVEGLSDEAGHYLEDKEANYTGPNITFLIPPKVLSELIEKSGEVEISDSNLKVESDRFTYMSALEVVP
jgi:hypothetical protein